MPVSDYEVVIGLEVHCQLRTRTKMFTTCEYTVGADPNTQIDAYTLGLPGTLPVPNRAAIDAAIRLARALDCEIQPVSRWARKHYFYPDLPKGYQITQADEPYARGGFIEIQHRDTSSDVLASKRIPLLRIHLEEDAGKNVHLGDADVSLIDYNRAGAPLVEIVSLPALRSAVEAADYMRELRTVVRYLGISEANMEEGTMRCDANVSLRPLAQADAELGTRCEIKNLNSFKFLEAAITAEIRRQADLLDRGQLVVQSTLSYDPNRDQTKVMRTKEAAADYRYFPEPDMPPLVIDSSFEAMVTPLPELPWARRHRLFTLGLSTYDAGVLTAERELCDYFDDVLALRPGAEAKPICNWITGELLRLLNAADVEIAQCPITPAGLAELLALVDTQAISVRGAKEVLDKAFSERLSPAVIVERDGYRQVSDHSAIVALVRQIVGQHPEQFAQLVAGKDKVRGFLVGQVMRASNGQANPQIVNQALEQILAEQQPEPTET